MHREILAQPPAAAGGLTCRPARTLGCSAETHKHTFRSIPSDTCEIPASARQGKRRPRRIPSRDWISLGV